MPIVTLAPTAPSDDEILRSGLGVQSWNVYPYAPTSGPSALTSQTIYAVAVGYRAGQVVTSIGVVVNAAATGAQPTGAFVGLCSTTTMLMDSANQQASTVWTTAGPGAIPLSSAYTIPATGLYYHLLLMDGAFGGTNVTLNRAANPGGNGRVGGAGPFFYATIGTGQTALPAVSAAVTLAATGSPLPFVTFST